MLNWIRDLREQVIHYILNHPNRLFEAMSEEIQNKKLKFNTVIRLKILNVIGAFKQ